MRGFFIDGKALVREREKSLQTRVKEFRNAAKRAPSLLAIELSDDPGSRLYLKLKKAAAVRIGIEFQSQRFTIDDLRFTNNNNVDGIFIQHPPGFDKEKWQKLVDQIPPEKDVDCLTSANLQQIKEGKPRFLPATVKAVIYCLQAVVEQVGQVDQVDQARKNHDIPDSTCTTCSTCSTLRAFLSGKHIVILGRSPIIGLPLSYWLKSLGGNVSLLHSRTSPHELRASSHRADILISTVGKPGIVTADMVKEGSIVIDCGSPSGDVVFGDVAPKTTAITPVPGGVGPLTVVSLMENVVQSAHLAGQKRLLTTRP